MAGLKIWRGLVLAALGAGMVASSTGVRAATPSATKIDNVTISMGYIPNVQFAPFYVADARGYYAAAHLHVSFDYAQSPDIIKLVAAGSRTFGNTEGDQVVLGRAQGLPVTYVLTQYQRFPVVIFSLQSSHITSFADLRGKTIGIPGLYGASYTGLLAALHAAHLTTHDVKIVSINYTQVSQVAQHQVDAAVGYAMNEPIQLQQLGYKVSVLPLASIVDLAGAGVVTSQTLVQKQPDLVKRFVTATLRGLKDTNADPAAAFTISRTYIKNISQAQFKMQLAELRAAVHYWTPAKGRKLGCASASQWTNTEAALKVQGQLSKTPAVNSLFTNQFLPAC